MKRRTASAKILVAEMYMDQQMVSTASFQLVNRVYKGLFMSKLKQCIG